VRRGRKEEAAQRRIQGASGDGIPFGGEDPGGAVGGVWGSSDDDQQLETGAADASGRAVCTRQQACAIPPRPPRNANPPAAAQGPKVRRLFANMPKKWTEPKVFMLTTSIGSTRSRPICYPIVTPRSLLSSGDHALLTCDWTLVAEHGIVQENKIGTHRTPSESPGRPHPWRKTAVSNGQTPPGTR
jgi:hypothetical protein